MASPNELRITLRDCEMICDGFRVQAHLAPSLAIDGDLLWGLEQLHWCPLPVVVEPCDEGVRVTPSSLPQQSGLEPEQLIDWREESVCIRQIERVEDAESAIHWWRGGTVDDVRGRITHHTWGRLLRLEAGGIGPEYILFPVGFASVYLGHLTLDWKTLRFVALKSD